MVVGGGFVGAEAAAVARGLGCEVTLVTDAAEPMGDALGDGLGAMLRAVRSEHGVRVMSGVRVDGILATDGHPTGARRLDGRTVDADAVLVGIGAQPNTEWLADSGMSVSNGVVCNATLHAGDGIWAAGDVAAWPHPLTGEPMRIAHRPNAAEQGLAVARNILAGPEHARPITGPHQARGRAREGEGRGGRLVPQPSVGSPPGVRKVVRPGPNRPQHDSPRFNSLACRAARGRRHATRLGGAAG